MKPLTPTATAALDALAEGPATTTELRTRTGAGRSTLDKALTELRRDNLVTRLSDDHPEHPSHWTLTTDANHPEPSASDQPDTGDAHEQDLSDGDESHADGAHEPELGGDNVQPEASDDDGSHTDGAGRPDTDLRRNDDVDQPDLDDSVPTSGTAAGPEAMPEDLPGAPLDDDTSGVDATASGEKGDPGPDAPTSDGSAEEPSPTLPPQTLSSQGEETPSTPDGDVKICRGCQSQMPKTCPTCWNKTSSYCGNCRRSGGLNGTPEILSNGLPKLDRGQLAELVRDVMRTHPLPDHLGITGWTSGRIAVYLPGRSTGAIGNALDKLANTGTAEKLGDNPKRYRLRTTQPAPEQTTTAADETAPPTDPHKNADAEEAPRGALQAPTTQQEMPTS